MDYDVKAASLASPPTSAPVQSYRPAVAVENLGIYPASVTGTLRIYDRAAGTLLVSMKLAANDIAPGETRSATADQLWEPVAGDIGKQFLFIATIVYALDQDLTNNNLPPVTVTVTAAPPPPPPPVEAHASQHEDGGGDEITIEGLTGKAAEAQTPTEHASNHESGGADEMSVSDLTGELADPQPPKTHASSHQPGGSDVITGIEPLAHHASHETGGDDVILGVEHTANKDQANGYPGLTGLGLVLTGELGTGTPTPGQVLAISNEGPAAWISNPVPGPHATSHTLDGSDIIHAILGHQADAHTTSGDTVAVGAGQSVAVYENEITWPTDITKALIIVMAQIYVPATPFPVSQILTVDVNLAGGGSYQIGQKVGQAAEATEHPMTLAALVTLSPANDVWDVVVKVQAFDEAVNVEVMGMHVIPIQ